MIEEFVKAIYGDNRGIVMILTKAINYTNPRPFTYPDELPRIVRVIEEMDALGANVYINMSLFARKPTETKWDIKAEKEYSIGCPVIWLDADNCHPDYIDIPSPIILETSPGSYQNFWPMNRILSQEEAEDIARRLSLKYKLHGADKGWNCNKYMRVPGTHNHKPERVLPNGDRPEVRAVKFETDRLDPETFSCLGSLEEIQRNLRQDVQTTIQNTDFYGTGTKRHYAANYPDPPALPYGATYPLDVQHLWNARDLDDRSKWAFDMAKALFQMGLPDEEAVAALKQHPIYIDKCKDSWGRDPFKIEEDVRRNLDKCRELGVSSRLNYVKPPPPQKAVSKEQRLKNALLGKYQPDDTDKWLDSEGVKNLPEVPWLIEGILPQRSQINFYGLTGLGKSFQVLDWCIRIANGDDWGDFKVTAAPVVYVVAEGLGYMNKRLMAWEHYFKKTLPARDRLMYFGDSVQICEYGALYKFIADIEAAAIKPGLIVFDTLAMCTIGMNENSPQDMSKVNGAMAFLRGEYKCSTLVVHHTGYDGDHERGHSAFGAAADTRIRLDEYMGHLKLECMKQRGGKDAATIFVEKKPVMESPGSSNVISLVVEPFPGNRPLTKLTPDVLTSGHLSVLHPLYESTTALKSNELRARSQLTEVVYLRRKSELEQSGFIQTDNSLNVCMSIEGRKAYTHRTSLTPVIREEQPSIF